MFCRRHPRPSPEDKQIGERIPAQPISVPASRAPPLRSALNRSPSPVYFSHVLPPPPPPVARRQADRRENSRPADLGASISRAASSICPESIAVAGIFFACSAAATPARRPKTSRSEREFPPSRSRCQHLARRLFDLP